MTVQRYSVNPQPIDILLGWIKSGEITIPEIQRPFVWEATKVRNFLDSLYKGYPVGYLILWRNPTIRSKDGTLAAGKRIMIDGQQRITALMASLLGREVLTKDYEITRIRIAFNPLEELFEVSNPAIQKNPVWIPDVAKLFEPDASLIDIVAQYLSNNPDVDRKEIEKKIEKLQKIINNQVGIIELAEDLDIDTVTEIFIRVNSAGTELSQADFAMSKIAANEKYGGNLLRKAIDYFCHLAVAPDFYKSIEKNDIDFVRSEFYPKMVWLKDVKDDLYDPSYTDMLRVAFTSEFGRGKLQDLVALLSGRNFETKQYEEEIAEQSFSTLKNGILHFMNKTNFDCVTMILRSAGFITNRLIGGKNTVNFAYILYLRAKKEGIKAAEIERVIRRWFVMSMLTGRYSGNPETVFDFDIRQIESHGVVPYVNTVIETTLNDSFWSALLPQQMETSSAISPYFLVYQAAQVKMKDKGFLSRDIEVSSLLINHSDVHHLFPRNYLKKKGLERGQYNQIANYAIAQSEINISIGDKPPKQYFAELWEQVHGGRVRYGGITEEELLFQNLESHSIPLDVFNSLADDYDQFLVERRKLMANKIRDYFNSL
ncbi:MAG: DUF262 domain-containing protein [Pelolinea sp.]|nr:DUF262 domain-containing protein [Pelolinea sp.]HAL94030.1 hypothetical protein [Spirochaetaceae bacterium]